MVNRRATVFSVG